MFSEATRRFNEAQAELEGLECPTFAADYPEGAAEREAALWEECRRLAEQIVTHHHWMGFEGQDRMADRSALKQLVKSGDGPSGGA